MKHPSVRDKILKLALEGVHYGDAVTIARELKTTPGTVRKYLSGLRKDGLIPALIPVPGQRERELAYRSAGQLRRRVARAGQPTESFARAEIYARDLGACWWCLSPVSPESWHMDHLIPVMSRATDVVDRPGHVRANVVVSCASCNCTRGNREDAWSDYNLLLGYYAELAK